jgi:hypothetical protein
MPVRASIIVWSAGGGALLGLIVDALIFGGWIVAANVIPGLSRAAWPKWAVVLAAAALAALPIAFAVLGFLEGQLKAS